MESYCRSSGVGSAASANSAASFSGPAVGFEVQMRHAEHPCPVEVLLQP
jgi:hypothetical protein